MKRELALMQLDSDASKLAKRAVKLTVRGVSAEITTRVRWNAYHLRQFFRMISLLSGVPVCPVGPLTFRSEFGGRWILWPRALVLRTLDRLWKVGAISQDEVSFLLATHDKHAPRRSGNRVS